MGTAEIKELRQRTGAGILDCKNALAACDGDIEAAIDHLRAKGQAAAAKKSARIAAEGLVHAYIHAGGKVGVLLEVNCETDFVAITDDFQSLVHDIAMHIAAANPLYVSRDDVSAVDVAHEREVQLARVKEEGKPDHIAERIVEGRMKKWFSQVCLLDQSFVKAEDKTVGDLVTEAVSRIGENIRVRRFVRYEVGEGLEKRSDDFANEVLSAAGLA